MNWNPFEFITQSKKDYSSIFNHVESITVEKKNIKNLNLVLEINIGKSAIIELIDEKDKKRQLVEL